MIPYSQHHAGAELRIAVQPNDQFALSRHHFLNQNPFKLQVDTADNPSVGFTDISFTPEIQLNTSTLAFVH
jgi:hypothetical protein